MPDKVEILIVDKPSPPVPTISPISYSGRLRGVAALSMASAAPAISLWVSPFNLRQVKRELNSISFTSPRKMELKSSSLSF